MRRRRVSVILLLCMITTLFGLRIKIHFGYVGNCIAVMLFCATAAQGTIR